MANDDPKDDQNSGGSDPGGEKPNAPEPPTPDDNIQAPESNWFQKSIPPDDNIEAPQSRWLTEGFDLDQPPPEDD